MSKHSQKQVMLLIVGLAVVSFSVVGIIRSQSDAVQGTVLPVEAFLPFVP